MGGAALSTTRSRWRVVGAVLYVGLRVAVLGGAALATYLLLTLLDGAAHADLGAGTDAGITEISQAVTEPPREVTSAVRVPASAPADRAVAGAKATQEDKASQRDEASQRDNASRGSLKKPAREVVRVAKPITRHVPQPPRLVSPSIVDDASGAVREVVTSVRDTVSEVLPGSATPPRLPLPGFTVGDQASGDSPVAGQVIDMLGGSGAPGDTVQEPPPAPPVAAAPSIGPSVAAWPPVVDVAVTAPPAPLIVPAETGSGGTPGRAPRAPENATGGRTVGGGDSPGGFALAGQPQWGPDITRGAALARPGDNRHGRPGDGVPPPPK